MPCYRYHRRNTSHHLSRKVLKPSTSTCRKKTCREGRSLPRLCTTSRGELEPVCSPRARLGFGLSASSMGATLSLCRCGGGVRTYERLSKTCTQRLQNIWATSCACIDTRPTLPTRFLYVAVEKNNDIIGPGRRVGISAGS